MPVPDNKPLSNDFMAIEPKHQSRTPLSFSVVANASGGELNSNYFRVVSVEGQEQVSTPFSFTIGLRANEINGLMSDQYTSADPFGNLLTTPNSPTESLPMVYGAGQNLLGQWAQLVIGFESDPSGFTEHNALAQQDSTTIGANALPFRYFSGIVASVSQSAPGEYSIEMQSPLFPMTLRNRYFVYQSLSITGLIIKLTQPECLRYGNAYTVDCTKIQGMVATRVQDWMQAGETDFAMLQRVMKKAAVFFYFIHGANKLTLVFSNQPTSPNEVIIPGCKTGSLNLRYSYTDVQSLGLQQSDLFCHLRYKVQMVPQKVGTVLACQQANWATNEVAVYDSYPASADTTDANYVFYQNYAYGVNKSESEEVNQQITQQVATQQGTLSGQCTSTLLSPGYTFTLTQVAINPKDAPEQGDGSEAPVTAENLMPSQFNGKTFVVTKITHKVTENTPYSGSIEATSVSNNSKVADTQKTFITPFDIHDTHQGNVLATVLKSAVPKNSYFFEKNNFQTELSSVKFDNKSQSQIGCLVQFATDEGTNVSHWVALSNTSQTAPAVNSMVMVGRGDNESEIPQIQQVVSSHGEKTIQPAFWRNNSWTYNTNWGSSCSTSYGDSMSIHYGSEATPHLKTAMNIVQTAYNNPTVLDAKFGGVSFSEGCSFSYSTTGKGAQGLASASVSQGSHFSESHSDQDYSVSYNNTRQSFSKSNKSVNVSYQGPFTDTVDEQSLNFINGKIPNQHIIDICDGLPDGSTYNSNHVTGQNINLSGTGAPPPKAPSIINAQSYSHSIVHGDSENINEQTGNTTSTSVFDGDKSDTSTVTGNTTSLSTFKGTKSDTSTVTGACESLSTFLGAKSDTSTVTGACGSLSTFLGAKSDTSIVSGVTTSLSTFLGAKSDISTVTGACESLSTFLGAKSDTSIVSGVTTSLSTFDGAKFDTNMVVGDSTSTNSVLGAKNSSDTHVGAFNENVSHLGEHILNGEVVGIESHSKENGGVATNTIVGTVASHTDERIKAIQISVTNITVEGIISIL